MILEWVILISCFFKLQYHASCTCFVFDAYPFGPPRRCPVDTFPHSSTILWISFAHLSNGYTFREPSCIAATAPVRPNPPGSMTPTGLIHNRATTKPLVLDSQRMYSHVAIHAAAEILMSQ